jgi:type I restriction enzyme, R subunit
LFSFVTRRMIDQPLDAQMAPLKTQTPEQEAREEIDRHLVEAGWLVQNRKDINLSAGRGVAIREFKMADGHGFADYLLYVDKQAVGALEAKPVGFTLSGVKPQVDKYSKGLPASLPAPIRPLPFLYVSTGVETNFVNLLDPEPRSRRVFSFHRPDTIAEWIQSHNLPDWIRGWGGEPPALDPARAALPSSLRARLRAMPPVAIADLWENKQRALENLEKSLHDDRPRALIQMATGSGKTMLAITSIYRLIKFGGARRVLFLVDRTNLGNQAEKEFEGYRTPDDHRKFDIIRPSLGVAATVAGQVPLAVVIYLVNDLVGPVIHLGNNSAMKLVSHEPVLKPCDERKQTGEEEKTE